MTLSCYVIRLIHFNKTIRSIFCAIAIVVSLGIFPYLYADTNAKQFDYWVWAGQGIKDLSKESVLYLHQGTVEKEPSNSVAFRRQGLGYVAIPNKDIFLAYRLEVLVDEKLIFERFKKDVSLWKLKGTKIVGIQIDYDCPTAKLSSYLEFLKKLKSLTKNLYSIGITGLTDWAGSGQIETLIQIQKITDEVVFQLYDYNREVPNLEAYIPHFNSLTHPFKLGIMPSQISKVPDLKSRLKNVTNFVIFRD